LFNDKYFRRGNSRQLNSSVGPGLTANDQLRQTTFLGWRDDKKPKEVVLE